MKKELKKKLVIRPRIVCRFSRNMAVNKTAVVSDPTTSTHTIVTTTNCLWPGR